MCRWPDLGSVSMFVYTGVGMGFRNSYFIPWIHMQTHLINLYATYPHVRWTGFRVITQSTEGDLPGFPYHDLWIDNASTRILDRRPEFFQCIGWTKEADKNYNNAT